MRATEFLLEYRKPKIQRATRDGIDLSFEKVKDDEYVDDNDDENTVAYVTASSNGKELGHVLFSIDGDTLLPQDLEVDDRYRGQGIAKIMYDYVKSLGYQIRRSGQQTDAGAGFWSKHRPAQNVWEDAGTPQYVYRIDAQPIADFAKAPQTYKHTTDWQQSGLDADPQNKWNDKEVQTAKGTFAGTLLRTAPYTTGNAKNTRFLQITDNRGQNFIYFDQKDIPKFRGKTTYLTTFSGKNFRPTAQGQGEYFSANPGQPLKQDPIKDPFQYITDAGWIVRTTKDLPAELARAKKLHAAGKIKSYGGEGLGVQEVKVNEIARIPQGDFGDKDTLRSPEHAVEKKPLPGGSGFTYAVDRTGTGDLEIMIFDGDTLAAELDLFETQDVTDAWRVSTVAVDPEYRSQGLGKALYGIALSILRLTLEAGDTQTRHGQRMWLMLNSIPGVEVMGYSMEPTDEYRAKPGDQIVDQNDRWTRYTFPVEPGRRSMRSTRRGTGIYSSQYVSMIAKWTGQ